VFKNTKIYKIIVFLLIFVWHLDAYAQTLNYDEAIEKVKEYIKKEDFKRAEELLKNLNIDYLNNPETLFLLGKVLFWQKKYYESLLILKQAYHVSNIKSIEKEIEIVEIAIKLQEAEELEKNGRVEEAKKIYLEMFKNDKDRYESGYRLGMIYFKEKDYTKAEEIFEKLINLYPEDIGFKELYVESLILNRKYEKAKTFLFSQPEEVKEKIKQKREDLFCRVYANYIKISSAFYSLSPSTRQSEKEYSIEISQKFNDLSFVMNFSEIKRYGLEDKQIHLDVYSILGRKTWGYLSFYYSPDAEFLPQTAYGGEIFQGYKNFEFSLGYTRMNFKNEKVDIFYPGFIIYLPYNFVIEEKLYYVPKTGGFSLVNSLSYNPMCKVWLKYSVGIGTSAEKIGAYNDIKKYNTYFHKFEGELPLKNNLSAGLEALFEHREGLYNKKGVNLFLKYWW